MIIPAITVDRRRNTCGSPVSVAAFGSVVIDQPSPVGSQRSRIRGTTQYGDRRGGRRWRQCTLITTPRVSGLLCNLSRAMRWPTGMS